MNIIILLALNRILPFIVLIFCLVILYYLIFLSNRVEGKVLKSIRFFMVAMIAYIIMMVLIISNLFNAILLSTFSYAAQIIIALMILLAFLNLKYLVDKIDGNHIIQKFQKRK